ncbi:YfjI family protein [Streptomyces sp. Edi2]|uniref:YfjI family protein n=1 Tax=Streptomyces sp. Edi2 TaxID=3162528 RepID=UPI003305DE24
MDVKFDFLQARAWLSAQYGSAPGLIAVASTLDWSGGQFARADQAAEFAAQLDERGAQGIYARVTTVRAPLPPDMRGTAEDSCALLDMWSDIDILGPGHKAKDLPADTASALRIWRESGLPTWSQVIHSGGGLYVRACLARPAVIGEDLDLEEAQHLARGWQQILKASADRLGVAYGAGVGDLPRVLRIPGTVNRKVPDRPSLCRVEELPETGAGEGVEGARYTLDEIRAIVADLSPAPRPRRMIPEQPASDASRGAGPLEILGQACAIPQILAAAGWAYREQANGSCPIGCGRAGCALWSYPGWQQGASGTGAAVHKSGACVTVWSETPGLPTGEVMSAGRLFAELHHGGDQSAAAIDILRAAHGWPLATAGALALPAGVLAEIRRVSDHHAAASRPTNPKNNREARMPVQHPDSGISGTHSVGQGWEAPAAIDEHRLPPLPVEHLGALAPFVAATAESLQVAPDLVAFAALATISTATGGRRRVKVKADWTEAIALYMAALADSSEKKTPALDAAAAPLREMEDEVIDAKRGAIEAKAQEIRIWTSRMARAEQAAAVDDPTKRAVGAADAEAARHKLLQLGESAELPRLLIRDATMEALVKRMHEQGGRIGLLASEANLLKIAGGMYSQNGQANSDLLLEAYTGSPYSVDRAGRTAIRMRGTFLALALLIQSGVLLGLAKKNPEFRENGLLGRFLYARPEPTAEDTFDSPEVPPAVREDYAARIKNLVRHVWDTDEVGVMRLTDQARKVFADFYDAFGKRRQPGGDLHEIAEWAGKLRGQVIRLAACLTLFEDPDTLLIGEERIRAAIALVPYLVAHAKSVYDLMGPDGDGRLKPARDLLDWARSRPAPGQADVKKYQSARDEPFRAREAWQALKGRRWAETMDDMNQAIQTLEDLGWLAYLPDPQRPEGTRGRKPSPRFDVHPWVYAPSPPGSSHSNDDCDDGNRHTADGMGCAGSGDRRTQEPRLDEGETTGRSVLRSSYSASR